MGKLNTTVHVYDDEAGDYVIVGPDSKDVPEHLLRKIGAHAFEDGEHPLGDVSEQSPDDESDTSDAGGIPPVSGPGSGVTAWRRYASEQGVEVPEGAKRADIVQALTDAGKPVAQ